MLRLPVSSGDADGIASGEELHALHVAVVAVVLVGGDGVGLQAVDSPGQLLEGLREGEFADRGIVPLFGEVVYGDAVVLVGGSLEARVAPSRINLEVPSERRSIEGGVGDESCAVGFGVGGGKVRRGGLSDGVDLSEDGQIVFGGVHLGAGRVDGLIDTGVGQQGCLTFELLACHRQSAQVGEVAVAGTEKVCGCAFGDVEMHVGADALEVFPEVLLRIDRTFEEGYFAQVGAAPEVVVVEYIGVRNGDGFQCRVVIEEVV